HVTLGEHVLLAAGDKVLRFAVNGFRPLRVQGRWRGIVLTGSRRVYGRRWHVGASGDELPRHPATGAHGGLAEAVGVRGESEGTRVHGDRSRVPVALAGGLLTGFHTAADNS